MATCHHCGYELEPGAKFCPSCATPVATAPGGRPTTPPGDAEMTSPVGVTPPPGAPPPPPTPPPPPGVTPSVPAGGGTDRRVWWIGGLGALVIVLVVVLVVVLTSGGSSPRTVVTTTTSTSPPTPPPTAPAAATPSATQIADTLSQTKDPQTGSGFQEGDMGSIPDGSGGMLTAVSGFDQSVNHPPCLVFFWHDDGFIGTDSTQTHMGCVLVHSGNGAFVVDYEVFAPTDPLCCPSGSDDVTYTWNGRSFAPNGAPPPSQ